MRGGGELGGAALLGGAAVEPGARGELGAALPGAAGAELVPCGTPGSKAGAADPGAAAEFGAGSAPGAASVPAAVVTVVEDDRGSKDVDAGRRARWSPAFARVPT